MLLEGAQGCGTARNASPSKLTRDVSLQPGYVAFEDTQEEFTRDSKILIRRDTLARMEVLGPVSPWLCALCV